MSAELIAILIAIVAVLVTATYQTSLLFRAIDAQRETAQLARDTARMVREAEEYGAQFDAVLFGTTKDIWELVRKLRPDFKH